MRRGGQRIYTPQDLFHITFAAFLRQERHVLRLKQAEVAATVGTTQSAVSDWESGRVGITLENAINVAAAFGYAFLLAPNDPRIAANYVLIPGEREKDGQ